MAFRTKRTIGFKKPRKLTRQHQVFSNTRKIAKLTRKMGQIETKFFDHPVDQSFISATGVIVPQIFTLSEGDGQSQRHGRKVHMTSVQWHGVVSLPPSAVPANASDTIRLLLVRDKQANGALPAVTDILVNAVWESFRNLEFKSRFSIIFDKRISMFGAISGDGSSSITGPAEKNFRLFKKLNIPIEYSDLNASGGIGTINSNNIVMLLITRLSQIGMESCMRFRYTDL